MKEIGMNCQNGGFLYSLVDFRSQLVTLACGDPQS